MKLLNIGNGGVLLAAAFVITAGCTQFREVARDDPFADPIVVCQTRASTINVLASLNEADRLSDAVAERVDDLVVATSPLCTADAEPSSNADTLVHLIDGVRDLVIIRLTEGDK